MALPSVGRCGIPRLLPAALCQSTPPPLTTDPTANRLSANRLLATRLSASSHQPSTTYNPNPGMWKICQEASPKSKVMTLDPPRLTSQNTQDKLALFIDRLGILIIGGKKIFSPPGNRLSEPQKARRGEPFPLLRNHDQSSLQFVTGYRFRPPVCSAILGRDCCSPGHNPATCSQTCRRLGRVSTDLFSIIKLERGRM